MQLVINLTSTFMLGLLTPLTAVAVISVLLIFNEDAGKIFPQARIPSVKKCVSQRFAVRIFFRSDSHPTQSRYDCPGIGDGESDGSDDRKISIHPQGVDQPGCRVHHARNIPVLFAILLPYLPNLAPLPRDRQMVLQNPQEPTSQVLPLRVAEQNWVVRSGVQLLKKLDIPACPS